MNPFFTSYDSQHVPCRFYAQGTCWNGDFCPFAHQPYSQSPYIEPLPPATPSPSPFPSPSLCRFYQSPTGCRNGEYCPFLHDKMISKQIPEAPTCQCVKENKHSAYKQVTNVQKKNKNKNKKKNMKLLCVFSNLLGNQVLEGFPLLELTSWNPTSNLWYFYNAKNRSTVKLRYRSDRFWLEGDPNHHYCILYWIESLFSSFRVTVEIIKECAVMVYHDHRAGELFVVPSVLSHRFNELHEKQNTLTPTSSPSKEKQSKSSRCGTYASVLLPLDAEDKLAILDYARQLAEQESESESEEIEESNEEEEETDEDNLDEDCSIFDGVEETQLLNNDCGGGYILKYQKSVVKNVRDWFEDCQKQSLFCHSFISQGGWHVLHLCEESKRMLDEASAGCGQACQLSEAISFDVLQRIYPALQLTSTEMEIEYWKVNSPKIDYLCSCNSSKIGVSVTRAWNGPHPFTTAHARRLLEKKLKGLKLALQYVSSTHVWDQQILHIWTPNEKISLLLSRELQFMNEILQEMTKPTLVIITNTQFDIPPQNSFLFRCD